MMNEEALQACINQHLEHAAMVLLLDDELGTHHGLLWADFVLLTMLDAVGGTAPTSELAHTLSTPPSRLLQRLLDRGQLRPALLRQRLRAQFGDGFQCILQIFHAR